jgi:hypothetical protein
MYDESGSAMKTSLMLRCHPNAKRYDRRSIVCSLTMLTLATTALLISPSEAGAAQSHRATACTVLGPTVEAATVRLALNDKFTTTKKSKTYQIESVTERNNKGSSGQCDFYATLKPATGGSLHEMIWQFYPYSARAKHLSHPNLVLPGLFGVERGSGLAAVIAGYGGFSETSAVGHATPAESAALDALALRWAVSHRVQSSSSSTTSTT